MTIQGHCRILRSVTTSQHSTLRYTLRRRSFNKRIWRNNFIFLRVIPNYGKEWIVFFFATPPAEKAGTSSVSGTNIALGEIPSEIELDIFIAT